MRLKKILKGLYYTGKIKNVRITGVTEILERVTKDSLFVAIRGEKTDGNALIGEAVRRGASAIVCEAGTDIFFDTSANISIVYVPDTRRALALICSNFYGNPSKNLCIVAITGTNGKTTTAYMLWHILSKTSGKTGLIGTVENINTGKVFSEQTTPHTEDLHKMFFEMKKNGCMYAVMEASSQGLRQKRTEGLNFCLGIFTNFSSEHMDYHKTENEYFNSKFIINGQSDVMLVNADDSKAEAFVGAKYFSVKEKTDFFASDIVLAGKNIIFTFNVGLQKFNVHIPGIGLFNVYNALCALAAAVLIGVDAKDAVLSLSSYRGIEGRQEFIDVPYPFDVVMDFAHTPESLEQILKALRPITEGKLICVFGCGGDRDKKKRPEMGKIAAEKSDFAIITSDNPRTEDPQSIINDIIAGIDESLYEKYTVVVDRKEAIAHAFEVAKPGDLILIAGKGHEKYQIVGTEKFPFDEKEIIKKMRL